MALTADFVTGHNVSFRSARMLLQELEGLQEGAWASGDLKISQHAGGANMSVDVAIGAGWVQIDTGARNGLAHCYNDAVANPAVTAAHATLPRIDMVVLQYNDTAIPAGVGGDIPTIRVIAGTATSGATLDNRSGAAALPNDALLLADLLIPAASTSVVTANIRDRRRWARGFRNITALTAGPTACGFGSPVIAASFRAETQQPLEAGMRGGYFDSSGTGLINGNAQVRVDGVVYATVVNGTFNNVNPAQLPLAGSVVDPLAAGNHLIELLLNGNGTVRANSWEAFAQEIVNTGPN